MCAVWCKISGMPRPAYDLAPIARRNLGPSAWPLRPDWIHDPARVLTLIETTIPQFQILYLSRDAISWTYADKDGPATKALIGEIMGVAGKPYERHARPLRMIETPAVGATFDPATIWNETFRANLDLAVQILRAYPFVALVRWDMDEGKVSLDITGGAFAVCPTWQDHERAAAGYVRTILRQFEAPAVAAGLVLVP